MKRRLSYALFAGAVMGGLMGCAGMPTQEMSDARQALQAARAAQADTHAPRRFGAAEQRLSVAERDLAQRYFTKAREEAVAARRDAIAARNMALAIADAKAAVATAEAAGPVSQTTRDWLARAEAAAAAVNEDEAIQAAGRAKEQAEEDRRRADALRLAAERENQSWLDKAEPLLREAQGDEARLTPALRERLREADAAYHDGDGRQAFDLAAGVLAELRAAPPAPVMLDYRVMRGDNLWKIAAKTEVYGNAEWWPLIYSANQERLADADLVEPGQTLRIDTRPAAAAVARAVEHARRRGDWSLGVREEKDRDYLRAVR